MCTQYSGVLVQELDTKVSLRDRSVVIASGSQTWREVMGGELENAGASVWHCSTLEELTFIVEAQRIDITLFDADTMPIDLVVHREYLWGMKGRLAVLYGIGHGKTAELTRRAFKIPADSYKPKPEGPDILDLVRVELSKSAGNRTSICIQDSLLPVNSKILLLEDRWEWKGLIRNILCEEGYEVVVADSYDQAVRFLCDDNFGLVIADIRLVDYDPENEDGIRFLRELKRRDPDGRTKRLVLTAYGDLEQERVAITELGADFFPKSYNYGTGTGFDREGFLNTVSGLIGAEMVAEDKSVNPREPISGYYEFQAEFPDVDFEENFRVGKSEDLQIRIEYKNGNVSHNHHKMSRKPLVFEIEIAAQKDTFQIEPDTYQKLELTYGDSGSVGFSVKPQKDGRYRLDIVLYCANRWMGRLPFTVNVR